MALYRYTAQNDQGKRIVGHIEAASLDQAESLLEDRGFIHREITQIQPGKRSDKAPVSELPVSELSRSEADELTQHIASVSAAKLPMADGLRAAADESNDRRVAVALCQMADRMDRGETLESILSSSHSLLPRPVSGLILAASRTGNLGGALAEFAELQRANRFLRRDLLSGFAYPLTVLCMTVIIFTFTFVYVTGTFEQMYEDFGLELPFMTKIILFWRNTGIWVAGGAILVGLFLFALFRLVAGRSGWLRLMSTMPLFGPIWHWSGVTDWAGLLSVLLKYGVPLPEALRFAGHGVRNSHVGEISLRLADGVSRGRSTSEMISATYQLPTSLVPLIRWGEQTGALAESFGVGRMVFERRVRARAMLLQTLLPPGLFILIGCSVFTLVVGLFMPLLNLISQLS